MKSKYKIGEIAKIYNISTDTLRLYEKMELLVPKRGENSYRYYTIFDVWKLNVIKTMKSLGVQLKDIKKFLENRSVEDEINLLEDEFSYIEEQIDDLFYQKNHIANRIEILKDAQNFKDDFKIFYKELPARKVVYIKTEITLDDEVDLAYTKLSNNVNDKISFFNRDFGMILSLNKAKKGSFSEYSKGFLIIENDMKYEDEISQGNYMLIRFRGPYSNAKKAYEILFKEIEEKNLKTDNYFIERYIVDINLTDNEDEYLTEIQIRILN
ncbi:MerR family transcriptional regulator [Peptoniphilus sp. MSJ-1]|uniref:MerR family transcriptional regulator n=1 Tax=Peptoniphilus ovalis TaxID=2841503 RepID=A0ABS6FGA1_9FIRM|nr:MerR family transcriptional regulator [Peptoniphilus ovalis]MBU5669215.1 MerR family transcriptional regulator [Peptoniphilus ovalis]